MVHKTKKNKTKTQHHMCWTPLCANKHKTVAYVFNAKICLQQYNLWSVLSKIQTLWISEMNNTGIKTRSTVCLTFFFQHLQRAVKYQSDKLSSNKVCNLRILTYHFIENGCDVYMWKTIFSLTMMLTSVCYLQMLLIVLRCTRYSIM